MSPRIPRSIATLLSVTLAIPALAVAMARLQAIDHSSENNRTRVVLRLSRKVAHEHGEVPLGEEPGQPRRLFVDLKPTRLHDPKGTEVEIGDPRVLRVRTGQFTEETARVVVDLSDPKSTYKIFTLHKPFRVVIDVFGHIAAEPETPPPEAGGTGAAGESGQGARVEGATGAADGAGEAAEGGAGLAGEGGPSVGEVLVDLEQRAGAGEAAAAGEPVAEAVGTLDTGESAGRAARSVDFPLRRIVLDPGHGGDQPGAVGKKGLQEKNVVLDVSKRLKRMAERAHPGLEVVLTRTDDITLGLEERTAQANRVEADLFISIHANAHVRRSRFGVETFYLNVTSDRYANRLAQVENRAAGKDLSDLQFILADLTRMANIEESRELARYIQGGMVRQLSRGWDQIKDLGVKSALFYVLLGAKMPACLVEMSFISHPREEERLRDPAYLDAVAEGILDGIEAFAAEQVEKKKE